MGILGIGKKKEPEIAPTAEQRFAAAVDEMNAAWAQCMAERKSIRPWIDWNRKLFILTEGFGVPDVVYDPENGIDEVGNG